MDVSEISFGAVTANLKLFYGYNTNTVGRLYSYKHIKNGVVMVDLVPVRVGSVGYLYDKKNGVIYGNSGTGNFVVGPDVEQRYQVFPVWKDDLAIDYQQESGQQFLRRQLSGTIDLVGADYDRVMNEAFGTVFYLDIARSTDNGHTLSLYWRGRFTLTDCQVDMDIKRMRVRLTTVDQYADILDGLDKEFDLIQLKPEIHKVLVRRRPSIQVYDQGDDVLTNVFGNMSFEQDVEIPSGVSNVDEYLRGTCHFSTVQAFAEMNFTTVPQDYAAAFATPFTGTIEGDGSTLTNSVGTYTIEYFEFVEHIQQTTMTLVVYHNGFRIWQNTRQDVKWEFEQSGVWTGYLPIPAQITFDEAVSGMGQLVCTFAEHSVYGRILCNVDWYGYEYTFPIGTNDIIGTNRNYKRVASFNDVGTLVQSTNYSTSPTEWGRRDDGNYFLPPDTTYNYVPIGRSKWVNTSLWLRVGSGYTRLERNGMYAFFINDCYPIASCIAVLLAQVAPSLSFAATSAYSQFLFSGSDPLASRNTNVYITPKSNVINGEYQTPAQTAPVTLRTLLNFLRDTYQCYWFVDDSNRLRIEQIQFFRNGGTYSGSAAVGTDLTTLECRRNGKKWAFATSKYEYDKTDMPERYQFEWMDEVTEPFKGLPIEVVSPYVQKGRVEEINVSQFTTDLDYMMLNPSAISQEGFAAMTTMQARAINGVYNFDYFPTGETEKLSVASYISGKTCNLLYYISSNGAARLLYYVGNLRIDSGIDLAGGSGYQTTTFVAPEGITAIALVTNGSGIYEIEDIWVVGDTDTIQTPFLTVALKGKNHYLQNGELAFCRLQLPYWRYDMPASALKINNLDRTALSVKRGKKQQLSFPAGDADPDVQQLVKTGLGNGQVQQMTIRLTSRIAKTTLKYDTE